MFRLQDGRKSWLCGLFWMFLRDSGPFSENADSASFENCGRKAVRTRLVRTSGEILRIPFCILQL